MLKAGKYAVITYVDKHNYPAFANLYQSYIKVACHYELVVVYHQLDGMQKRELDMYKITRIASTVISDSDDLNLSLFKQSLLEGARFDYILLLSPNCLISAPLTPIFEAVINSGYYTYASADETTIDTGLLGLDTSSVYYKRACDDVITNKSLNLPITISDRNIHKPMVRLYHPTEDALSSVLDEYKEKIVIRYGGDLAINKITYNDCNSGHFYKIARQSLQQSHKILLGGHEYVISSIIKHAHREWRKMCSGYVDTNLTPTSAITLSDYSDDVVLWWSDDNIPIRLWGNAYWYKSANLTSFNATEFIHAVGDPILEMTHLIRTYQYPPRFNYEIYGEYQSLRIHHRYDNNINANTLVEYLCAAVKVKLQFGSDWSVSNLAKICGFGKIHHMDRTDDWASYWISEHICDILETLGLKDII